MTRFPIENRNAATGIPEDELGKQHVLYKVGPVCATPGCTRLTDHAHHVFSRGLMGGAYEWVRLDDGHEIFNKVPLCYKHHEQVTNNESRIHYEDTVGPTMFWSGDGVVNQPLTWQPPIIHPKPPVVVETIPKEEAEELGAVPNQYCPTCKRKYRHKPAYMDLPPEERRPRMTWAIGVPVDHYENGYQVLEEQLQACVDLMEKHGLEWGEGRRNRYFQLSTVLGLFAQHGDQILGDS